MSSSMDERAYEELFLKDQIKIIIIIELNILKLYNFI